MNLKDNSIINIFFNFKDFFSKSFINFFAQLSNGLLLIIVMPLYANYFNVYEFGVISVFFLIQSLLLMFGAGLNPILMRISSILINTDSNDINEGKVYFKKIILLSLILSLIPLMILFIKNSKIFYFLINFLSINSPYFLDNLFLVMIIISLRFLYIFISGILNGLNFQKILGLFTIAINIIRYIIIFLIVFYKGLNLNNYFFLQAAISFIEVTLLVIFLIIVIFKYNLINKSWVNSKKFLKEYNSLILNSYFISIIGVISINFDKIIITNILGLDSYGKFYLISITCSLVILIVESMSKAIMPNLVKYHEESNFIKFNDTVFTFILILSCIFGSVYSFVIFKPDFFLYLILRNDDFDFWQIKILRIILLGYIFAALVYIIHLISLVKNNLKIMTRIGIYNLIFQVTVLLYAYTLKNFYLIIYLWSLLRFISFCSQLYFLNKIFLNKDFIRLITYFFIPIIISLVTMYILNTSINYLNLFNFLNNYYLILFFSIIIFLFNLFITTSITIKLNKRIL